MNACPVLILYQLVRWLRGLSAVLVWRDLSKEAESYIRAPQVPALRAPAGTVMVWSDPHRGSDMFASVRCPGRVPADALAQRGSTVVRATVEQWWALRRTRWVGMTSRTGTMVTAMVRVSTSRTRQDAQRLRSRQARERRAVEEGRPRAGHLRESS
jgi:hypothetical protein